MQRLSSTPRHNWEAIVEDEGLEYHTEYLPDGSTTPYWTENAYYEFTSLEVDYLETVTEHLHLMAKRAARYIAQGHMGDIGLPDGALELITASLDAEQLSAYGRFDLCWGGDGHATLLEYNADTPTGLFESAVTQWTWLEHTAPDVDQWNSLHERLIGQWKRIGDATDHAVAYFAYHPDDPYGEERVNTLYMRNVAMQAGLRTAAIKIPDIGLDTRTHRFVDLRNCPIKTCFMLYPWEDMLDEEFGKTLLSQPLSSWSTTWIEPVWKAALSNKILLAAMWRLFPGHVNLLPTFVGSPGVLHEYVKKPLFGREGSNIEIHAEGNVIATSGHYGDEGHVFQQWSPLPSFDGNRPVLGSWIVGDDAAGLGIRETDGPITDEDARFVPHRISGPSPSDEERIAWLSEDFKTSTEEVRQWLLSDSLEF